jgi:hypothetical protein
MCIGGCKGCKRTDVPLVVDHDHSCCPGTYTCGECVRGALCGDCNKAIGLLRDNTDTMKNLMYYLEGGDE